VKPERAALLVLSWRQDGYNLAEMLLRYFTRPAVLPDGEMFRELTEDGKVIQTEIYRQDEITALIEAATYFANVE